MVASIGANGPEQPSLSQKTLIGATSLKSDDIVVNTANEHLASDMSTTDRSGTKTSHFSFSQLMQFNQAHWLQVYIPR